MIFIVNDIHNEKMRLCSLVRYVELMSGLIANSFSRSGLLGPSYFMMVEENLFSLISNSLDAPYT